ncbi:hybrid sensor histidine kinase/response regulator [Vibrio algivorus]|uniref:histidine kinase n=1 Tax=Vibrio algivorus TaxID=1667024 RepID=A0A557P2M2_9VIBR|nr:hybrid sensor histidine kinase/response regulator [Vibrio algivorus]TVO34910.1 response regulator [Vibrio algivorus]
MTKDREKESQLRNATEAAQAAVIARQQFLATMSHELRTPIAGMVGLLEILKKHLNTEESRIITNNIIASSRHLHLLVNDILDYSKLEAGKLKLELRECSLSRELNELFRIHCIAARQKGLNFKLSWKTDNVKIVVMDPLRMSQIFNNLLSNAVKFTQNGGVEVTVDAYEKYFSLSVKDSGEGMDPSVIEHVFEPFKQADSSIARRFGGTGLGLSIVKSLVDVIGGDIQVESEVGKGTIITVNLPYQKVRGFEEQLPELDIHYHGFNPVVMEWIDMWQAHAKKTKSRKRVDIVFDSDVIKQRDDLSDNIILISDKCKEFKRARGGLIELSLSPLFPDLLFDTLRNIEAAQDDETEHDLDKLEGHILVAEDNAINRMVFKTQLQSIGLTCHIVENGNEALTLLLSQPDEFDLLITDCHMPVMDGYELSKKVRELIPPFDQKAIIGCTAEDLRVNQDRLELTHFDQILYKPYGLTGLHSVLAQYLTGKEVDKVNFWREHFGDEAELMASVFVESMTDDIAKLKDAVNNISTQKQIIHKIKGGAAAVGIDDIFDIAVAVEHATLIEGSIPKDKLNQLIKCTENYINKAQLITDSKRENK